MKTFIDLNSLGTIATIAGMIAVILFMLCIYWPIYRWMSKSDDKYLNKDKDAKV
jgi:hypothetical protein